MENIKKLFEESKYLADDFSTKNKNKIYKLFKDNLKSNDYYSSYSIQKTFKTRYRANEYYNQLPEKTRYCIDKKTICNKINYIDKSVFFISNLTCYFYFDKEQNITEIKFEMYIKDKNNYENITFNKFLIELKDLVMCGTEIIKFNKNLDNILKDV